MNTIIIDDRRADGIRGFDDHPAMDPPAGGGTGPGSSGGGGGGGFLSNRRIKLTAVFPMIGGTRRTISKSDSSSLAKTGNPERSVANAAATAAAAAKPPVSLPRNRMRRGSSLTDLKRSDSLAGTPSHYILTLTHAADAVSFRSIPPCRVLCWVVSTPSPPFNIVVIRLSGIKAEGRSSDGFLGNARLPVYIYICMYMRNGYV